MANRATDLTGDGNSTVALAAGRPAGSPFVVIRSAYLRPGDALRLYDMYETAFSDIDTRAVQRHLMSPDEFVAMCADARIGKYVAHVDGMPVGVSVMTSDLAAWPLVSVRYFERFFPDRIICYVGFVAARARSMGVFVELVERMYQDVKAVDGVTVMDFCAINVDVRRIPERTTVLLSSMDANTKHTVLDRQEFHLWDFREGSDA